MTTSLSERYSRSRVRVQRAIQEYNERPALRAYMEIFLTLAAISLFGIFAIRPTIITIGKLLQEIKAKETTLKTMNEKITNLNIAKELYTSEGEKIELVKQAIPNKPQPHVLALQIEELAKTNNATINTLTIENTQIIGEPLPEDDQTLTLTLNIFGDYQNLIKFAKDMENLRRPIKYDKINITLITTREGRALYMGFDNLSTPYTIR